MIIVKYKHPDTQAVKEEFLGILEVHIGQKTLIIIYLKKLGLPLNRMIYIGFDKASVNTGARPGLGTLLTTMFEKSLNKCLGLYINAFLKN